MIYEDSPGIGGRHQDASVAPGLPFSRYIDDIIEAFILSCKKENIKGIYNLGSGKEIKLKEIINILKEYINLKVKFDKPYRENEIWHYYLDISKTKKELNWKPKIELKEGLKRTLNWWKNNG